MSRGPRATDVRVIGALVAMGLPAALLVIAALLLYAGVSAAWALVLVGAVALVAGPILGWRYAARAASGRQDNWSAEALTIVILIEASLVTAWSVQALVGGAESGISGLALPAYLILMGVIVSGALTFIVVLPMGLIWTRILRSLAAGRPA